MATSETLTDLKLFKFIRNEGIEYHYRLNNNIEDVVIFVYGRSLEAWNNLIPAFYLEENGMPAVMKKDYFCFWMKDLCEYYNIEMEEVFLHKND